MPVITPERTAAAFVDPGAAVVDVPPGAGAGAAVPYLFR